MNNDNFEIERKFLIALPIDFAKADIASKSKIEQIYLKDTAERKNTRIRKRVFKDVTEYTTTSKIRISNMKRIENEKDISQIEYELLKQQADKDLLPIQKIRYVINYKNQFFEIDVYDFWKNAAVMEIEMENENTKITFPPFIKIIAELTDDKSFTNHSMAKQVPDITKYLKK